nr:HlyD family efflux transporter periplasmic adaptor subunit [Verrucomicrobium spinosum]
MPQQVRARESDKLAAEAVVVQRESELYAERLRLDRSEALAKRGALAVQTLDDDRARVKSSEAAISAAKAQVAAAEAAVEASKAQMEGANSTVEAAGATIARIKSDIADCTLLAPRAGRVQYRITQPGEVLGAGGKVLNIVDLSDVYMTFFLPETVVGRVPLGAEARIILDAVPQYVIPARITYVASVAQFTPKTVETASERQKLMFRVKARIDPELLLKHLQQVKTGVPGTAWLNLEAGASWPSHLSIKVPE